jgi:hypothetical protein
MGTKLLSPRALVTVVGVIAIAVLAMTGDVAFADGNQTTPPRIVTFLPTPGRNENLAFPTVDYSKPVVAGSLVALQRDWPDALTIAPADRATFVFAGAVGYKEADGSFMLEASYQGTGQKVLRITSWTPAGQVEISIPTGPTHRGDELVVAGRQVIVIMPTENVVERRGLYRAYITGPYAVHQVEANDFSVADDFVGLITRMATTGEIAAAPLAPSPPLVGTGLSAGEINRVRLAGFVLLVAGSLVLAVSCSANRPLRRRLPCSTSAPGSPPLPRS